MIVRIEIHRNGRVYSDLETPALIIEEGAIFEGNCVMVKDGAKLAMAKPAAN